MQEKEGRRLSFGERRRVGFGHLDAQWRLYIDHDWTDGSVASAAA